jgi:hypothetical protein
MRRSEHGRTHRWPLGFVDTGFIHTGLIDTGGRTVA